MATFEQPARIYNNRNITLKEKLIDKFWNNYDKETIAPILKEMDSKEKWVVANDPMVVFDLNEIMKKIKKTELPDEILIEKENIDLLITILAYMHTSWAMRILKWFDDYRNAVLVKMTMSCLIQGKREENSYELTPSQLYMERMVAIKNMMIISSIFNPDKIRALNNILASYEDSQFNE